MTVDVALWYLTNNAFTSVHFEICVNFTLEEIAKSKVLLLLPGLIYNFILGIAYFLNFVY
jgi:hypothetical protein